MLNLDFQYWTELVLRKGADYLKHYVYTQVLVIAKKGGIVIVPRNCVCDVQSSCWSNFVALKVET